MRERERKNSLLDIVVTSECCRQNVCESEREREKEKRVKGKEEREMRLLYLEMNVVNRIYVKVREREV